MYNYTLSTSKQEEDIADPLPECIPHGRHAVTFKRAIARWDVFLAPGFDGGILVCG
jgi:hypothetical protein